MKPPRTDETHTSPPAKQMLPGVTSSRRLTDQLPIAVIGFDASGVVVYRNPAAVQALGAGGQVHRDDRARLETARQGLKVAGDRYEQVYRWLKAGGELRWIKEAAQRLPEVVDGIAVMAHQIDITETQDESTRLKESLLRQEGLLRCAADPILTLDSDLQVISCNHAAERLLGVSGAEMRGHPMRRWLRWGETSHAALVPGARQTMVATHSNGAALRVEASVSVLELRGSVLHTLILRDMREHHRMQQRLAAAQTQQRLVLQAAGMGSWQLDIDGGRLRVSEEARVVLGCSPQELLESFEHLILHIHPSDQASVIRQWQQVADNGQSYEQTYRVIEATGATRWVSERGRGLDTPHLRRVLGVVIDITEQRQREAELAAMADRLRTLGAQLIQVQEHERRHLARELHDQIGQQLTAGLIEVRNPDLQLPDALRAHWIEQFGGLIQQVRTLSLDLSPAMLDDLGLVPALRSYAQRQAALGRLALTLALDEDLGRLRPELENAVFRIAQEAMTNVLRHANATQLSLSLARAGAELVLVVADDGMGLPLDMAEAPAHFGMMGMRERAALRGGELQIESRAGEGLRIELRLPIPA